LTLTRLLEIKLSFLPYQEEKVLSVADRIWREHGAPTDPEPLSEAIEAALRYCVEEGITYPRILLKRKKQLQRGAWKPNLQSHPLATKQVANTDGSFCARCEGTGVFNLPNGFGSLCPCGAWKLTISNTGMRTEGK
jgi:hypothetical protein